MYKYINFVVVGGIGLFISHAILKGHPIIHSLLTIFHLNIIIPCTEYKSPFKISLCISEHNSSVLFKVKIRL